MRYCYNIAQHFVIVALLLLRITQIREAVVKQHYFCVQRRIFLDRFATRADHRQSESSARCEGVQAEKGHSTERHHPVSFKSFDSNQPRLLAARIRSIHTSGSIKSVCRATHGRTTASSHDAVRVCIHTRAANAYRRMCKFTADGIYLARWRLLHQCPTLVMLGHHSRRWKEAPDHTRTRSSCLMSPPTT